MIQFLSGRFSGRLSGRFSRKAVLATVLATSTLLSACGTALVDPPQAANTTPAYSGGKVTEAPLPAALSASTQAGFGIQSAAQAPRVLMVVANRDFWYGDYAFTRQGLLNSGAQVTVAAASSQTAYPQAGSGGSPIQPDLALADVNPEDFDAIVFMGGWGASAYQYGFGQTYAHPAYNGSASLRSQTNQLISTFLAQGKFVSALCHGVTALAYARVDGVSPLMGRQVVGWNGYAPQIQGQGYPTSRMQIESNGAIMAATGAVGNPATSTDDVVVDGQIITGENVDSGYRLGQVLVEQILHQLASTPSSEASHIPSSEPTTEPSAEPSEEPTTPPVLSPTIAPSPISIPTSIPSPTTTSAPNTAPSALSGVEGQLPVLMVIANRDFYYREYAVPRAELQAAGLQVHVAAQTTQVSYPHPDSGQGPSNGAVIPDLALEQVRSENYSAILFVGGWGSSAYQYAPPGVYTNSLYNGTPEVKATANRLIGEFMAQNKYVTAICHGVSVLAWARVNGSSPLAGRRATGGPFLPHLVNYPPQYNTAWYISANQGIVVPSRSIGNPHTAADDVIVDGRIIVAEDYDSAELFGQTLAQHLLTP
ncbi:MAG: hypothetical protein AB7I41_11030 [Candidatus Sericytochromatia bacterium]